jgi:transposase InsO family protein|tara:strand:- start:74 stop:1048 length:975 start_codon:yes stop_codon:yes gene_type:complete
VTHDIRDQVVDFVRRWSARTEIPSCRFVDWLGIASSKWYQWCRRYGCVNEHNAWVPRDFWLETWEKDAILAYHDQHRTDGYRRLTYMMLDANVVAVSASTVYRHLSEHGRLRRWNGTPSKKGQGFVPPRGPHAHWHIDVSYINLAGTFYYLCSILDGFSRSIVHWDLRESMKEQDIEIVLQRARERYPWATPRIISDNGPQFIAKDFKQFIRVCGMTHVRTSPYYPQSNGKIERWHHTVKAECIRPRTPLSLEEARRQIAEYVVHYNDVRLHSAINYITPKDKLEGRAQQILQDRDRKLQLARDQRQQKRQLQRAVQDTRPVSV